MLFMLPRVLAMIVVIINNDDAYYVDTFFIYVVIVEFVVGICVGIAGMTCVDGVLSCRDDVFSSLLLMSTMVSIWASSYVCVLL